jgi:hypothetical protein
MKAKMTVPVFIEATKEKIRLETFQDERPANVLVNAPVALIQTSGRGMLTGMDMVLTHPVYAAAPEMYDALRWAHDGFVRALGDCGLTGKEIDGHATIVAIRAAIAKAEGE